MGPVSGVVVFLMTWWTAIFMVLPWGLKRDDQGRPDDPKLKQKVIYTTLLTVVIWLCVDQLVRSDIISFREMAARM